MRNNKTSLHNIQQSEQKMTNHINTTLTKNYGKKQRKKESEKKCH